MTNLWFEMDETTTRDISNGIQQSVFRVRFIHRAVLHIHAWSRGAPLGLFENTYLQWGLLNHGAWESHHAKGLNQQPSVSPLTTLHLLPPAALMYRGPNHMHGAQWQDTNDFFFFFFWPSLNCAITHTYDDYKSKNTFLQVHKVTVHVKCATEVVSVNFIA